MIIINEDIKIKNLGDEITLGEFQDISNLSSTDFEYYLDIVKILSGEETYIKVLDFDFNALLELIKLLNDSLAFEGIELKNEVEFEGVTYPFIEGGLKVSDLLAIEKRVKVNQKEAILEIASYVSNTPISKVRDFPIQEFIPYIISFSKMFYESLNKVVDVGLN